MPRHPERLRTLHSLKVGAILVKEVSRARDRAHDGDKTTHAW